MQIYKRTNEGDTAEDTDIPGKLVIKYRPIDMRVAKFLQRKHKHRPGISLKIRRYDKEPYIPVNLKASNEAVEENRLESKIRDV